MTALIVAFITAHIGAIVGGVTTLGAALWAVFERKGAQTVKAQAAQSVADAQKQVAQVQTSEAQANADAQKAGSDAAAARTQIDNDTAAESPTEVRNELQNWTRS